MKILVVDRSSLHRRTVVSALQSIEYRDVVEGGGDDEAQTFLSTMDIGMVIIGWVRDEGDRLNLVQWIRSEDAHRKMPVIVTTDRAFPEDVVAAMKAGVNSFLLRPFAPERLREEIESLPGTHAG